MGQRDPKTRMQQALLWAFTARHCMRNQKKMQKVENKGCPEGTLAYYSYQRERPLRTQELPFTGSVVRDKGERSGQDAVLHERFQCCRCCHSTPACNFPTTITRRLCSREGMSLQQSHRGLSGFIYGQIGCRDSCAYNPISQCVPCVTGIVRFSISYQGRKETS